MMDGRKAMEKGKVQMAVGSTKKTTVLKFFCFCHKINDDGVRSVIFKFMKQSFSVPERKSDL